MKNLDLACAELGRKLAETRIERDYIDETVFTAALGVLEEQGPYACFLYLQAREGEHGKWISRESAAFLSKALQGQKQENGALAFVKSLADDLDQLLFVRDLLRQVFVYARYHAKARGSTGDEK
ncbi:MAG: hypothetical protein AB1563_13905 [Bacillota bacterium]|jgi:hypothetical protein